MNFIDKTAIKTKTSNKGEPKSSYDPFSALHEDENKPAPARKISKDKVKIGDPIIIHGEVLYVEKIFPYMVVASGKCVSLSDLVTNHIETESPDGEEIITTQDYMQQKGEQK